MANAARSVHFPIGKAVLVLVLSCSMLPAVLAQDAAPGRFDSALGASLASDLTEAIRATENTTHTVTVEECLVRIVVRYSVMCDRVPFSGYRERAHELDITELSSAGPTSFLSSTIAANAILHWDYEADIARLVSEIDRNQRPAPPLGPGQTEAVYHDDAEILDAHGIRTRLMQTSCSGKQYSWPEGIPFGFIVKPEFADSITQRLRELKRQCAP
jgi:hypothetical protein